MATGPGPIRDAMNDERYLEWRENHRQQVVHRALLYTPGAIVLTGLAVWAALGLWSTIVMFVILGIAAVAIDIEALSALRDLGSRPVRTVGLIQRSWTKSRFLFFGRVHYLIVERRLFEISPLTAAELNRGDEVRIEHWPHSNVIVSLERLRTAREIEDER
jgi:hypothetical protein